MKTKGMINVMATLTFFASAALATASIYIGVDWGLRGWIPAIPPIGFWRAAIVGTAIVVLVDAVVSSTRLMSDVLYSRHRIEAIAESEEDAEL